MTDLATLLTVESIATILLYMAMGAGWAYVGYRRNHAAHGESLQPRKAVPVLVAGGGVGLAIVLSGHSFESGHVMAVAGFLVPLLDKVWNAVSSSTETATEMARDGASVPEIALAVAEDLDDELDVKDIMAVVAEYERRFGTLDPDPKHVEQRADELRERYEEDGPEGVRDELDGESESGSEPEAEPETEPEDLYSWPSSSIVKGPPEPTQDPYPDAARPRDIADADGDDDDDIDDTDSGLHETA